MSFTQYEQARPRLQRSELAVPGSNPGMFEKAAKSDADYVFLDCEDAVVPDDKAQARKNIIEGLNDIDWGKRPCLSVSTVWIHITCIAMWLISWNRRVTTSIPFSFQKSVPQKMSMR